MSSRYEFWLTDDAGRRILLLNDFVFFSYSRSVSGYGTFEIGLPYQTFKQRVSPIFQPDRRVDVWRSPSDRYPMRREQTYLIRMPKIYTRQDGVEIISLYGRDPKDLLARRYIIQAAGTSYTRKTGYADDMMKEIVLQQMLYAYALDPDGVVDMARGWPSGEFSIQGNLSLGPVVTNNFSNRNVLDTLKDIRGQTAQIAIDTLGAQKIHFDMVPVELQWLVEEIQEESSTAPILDESGKSLIDELSSMTSAELGFRFETFAGLRGTDRTTGIVFSQQNNNLKYPYYSESRFDEINTVIVKGFGRGDSRAYDTIQDIDRVNASRWNRSEGFVDASNEPDQDALSDAGQSALYNGRPNEELSAVFLNVEGGPDSPQALYGVDWDLGDLLPVEHAGKRFNVEVDIVYVAIDENGQETITGRNTLNNSEEI
jgi:hypothetical protein